MNERSYERQPPTGGDLADHVTEARLKARRMLAAESHVVGSDDLRQSLLRARDGILVVWIAWVALHGFGVSDSIGPLLFVIGAGISLFLGLIDGLAVHAQVQYFESELRRERQEIRDDPEHEREEVRSIYAAKGFQSPLLDQIADTLCADDDRLLKVMMEEELGIFIHQQNHPVLVGLISAGGSLAGALALAVPAWLLGPGPSHLWAPIGGVALLAVVALINGRNTGRTVPMLATWLLVGGVCGGFVHFLAQWLPRFAAAD